MRKNSSWIEHNIQISQGSGATDFMRGNGFYCSFFRSNENVKELLKSVYVFNVCLGLLIFPSIPRFYFYGANIKGN